MSDVVLQIDPDIPKLMPRLSLSLPEEFGRTDGTPDRQTERTLTDRPPGRIGAGQRAHDELSARTIRWLACWAGKERS